MLAFGTHFMGASMVFTTTMVAINRYMALCYDDLYEKLYHNKKILFAFVSIPYIHSAISYAPVLFEHPG